jgi:hypothetical protein
MQLHQLLEKTLVEREGQAGSVPGHCGHEELSGYQPGEAKGHRGFCKHCGVIPYGWVPASEWNDSEYVSVNVAALDDLEPAELMAAPVQYMDGRADNWWSPPKETRHL